MKVEWVTVGPFQENSYLLQDESTGKAVVVDPGDEAPRIIRMFRNAGCEPEAIWLTHAHLDHIGGISALRCEWRVPVFLHPADLPVYHRGAQSAARYGLPFEQPEDPDEVLVDGQTLAVGATRLTVRHVPGHSPGHVVFIGEDSLIGGDLLFAGSIGRTDLPLSNPDDMERSLALLSTFDPALTVYPGHGPPTTIATELAANPFLAGVRTSI